MVGWDELRRRSWWSAPVTGSSTLRRSITRLLYDLVSSGAALGWVDPPSAAEVRDLLTDVLGGVDDDDSALVVAWLQGQPVGFGYWRRYARPTHRPHADVEKVAVDPSHQGRGVGRAVMEELVATAGEGGIEVLTLDLRGDDERAVALYESLGFRRYGVLERFVAVGSARYDKLFYALDLRRPAL
jgi:ribosomal protein S18 acetylase RimI-like enzyme